MRYGCGSVLYCTAVGSTLVHVHHTAHTLEHTLRSAHPRLPQRRMGDRLHQATGVWSTPTPCLLPASCTPCSASLRIMPKRVALAHFVYFWLDAMERARRRCDLGWGCYHRLGPRRDSLELQLELALLALRPHLEAKQLPQVVVLRAHLWMCCAAAQVLRVRRGASSAHHERLSAQCSKGSKTSGGLAMAPFQVSHTHLLAGGVLGVTLASELGPVNAELGEWDTDIGELGA